MDNISTSQNIVLFDLFCVSSVSFQCRNIQHPWEVDFLPTVLGSIFLAQGHFLSPQVQKDLVSPH